MFLQSFLLFIIGVSFNAAANLCIKLGVSRVSVLPEAFFAIILKFIKEPYIIIGAVFFSLSLASYAMVLAKLNLSFIYPLWVAISFCIIITFSIFFLKESLSIMQIFGLIIIIIGIWLTAAFVKN